MLGLSTSELAIAGAAFTITVLLFATLFKRKPQRAEKWEKAAIMKQLLELSERENAAATPAPVKVRAAAAGAGARPGTSPLKATTKATLPARSKR